MKKISILFIVQLLFCYFNLQAQQFTFYSWNDYKGQMFNKTVYFSVYPDDENVMVGNYFFAGTEEKISLQGSWNKDSIVLKSFKNDKIYGWFRAKLNAETNHDLSGTFVNLKGDSSTKFTFKFTAICAGDFKNRYSFLYGTDNELEAFAGKIKLALQTNDKTWLSSVIQYPIQVEPEPGKPFLIRSRQQFVEQYHKLFDIGFKEKILAEPFINLNANAECVKIGDGLIWIYNTKKSNEEKYEYCIIKINK